MTHGFTDEQFGKDNTKCRDPFWYEFIGRSLFHARLRRNHHGKAFGTLKR